MSVTASVVTDAGPEQIEVENELSALVVVPPALTAYEAM
jgi:hypothetical protein